jgi:hypothetical protein
MLPISGIRWPGRPWAVYRPLGKPWGLRHVQTGVHSGPSRCSTSRRSRATNARPPARLMRSRQATCSGLVRPFAAFTSTPSNRPILQLPQHVRAAGPAEPNESAPHAHGPGVLALTPRHGGMRSQGFQHLHQCSGLRSVVHTRHGLFWQAPQVNGGRLHGRASLRSASRKRVATVAASLPWCLSGWQS